jgi:hypothetical protein
MLKSAPSACVFEVPNLLNRHLETVTQPSLGSIVVKYPEGWRDLQGELGPNALRTVEIFTDLGPWFRKEVLRQ